MDSLEALVDALHARLDLLDLLALLQPVFPLGKILYIRLHLKFELRRRFAEGCKRLYGQHPLKRLIYDVLRFEEQVSSRDIES